MMNEVAKMIVELHVEEQPAGLASAPILDGWEIKRAHTNLPLIAMGRLSGSGQLPNGRHITTSMIVAVDSRMRWIATQNAVYRLGWQAGRMDPVWRAAAVGWRDIAISTIIRETGELTVSPALLSQSAVARSVELATHSGLCK